MSKTNNLSHALERFLSANIQQHMQRNAKIAKAPKINPRKKHEMTQFQVGNTYATRSMVDYDCVFSFTIMARTAKTITTDVHGKIVRRGIFTYKGVEQFKPFGTHSMCAIISADDRSIALAAEAAAQ